MDSYRRYPARLEIPNLSMNGAPVLGTPAFQTRMQDYVVKDPLCASTFAAVQDVNLQFKTRYLDVSGIVYWSEAISNGQPAIPLDSTFCHAEFLDDLVFDWPAQVNRPERRIAATVGGWHGVMTNVQDTEMVFKFSPLAYVWKLFNSFFLSGKMETASPADLGARKNWCAFGREDCLAFEILTGDVLRENVLLSKIAPNFLTAHARTLLMPVDWTGNFPSGFRVRFHNYPDDPDQVHPAMLNSGIVRMRVKFVPPSPPPLP
jgi:hypothetical protein